MKVLIEIRNVNDPGLVLEAREERLPVKIGKLSTSTIRFPDDVNVSRLHALIDRDTDSGAIVVQDLSSSTGTFIGNQRVMRAVVQPTDHIRIGAYTLTVRPVEEPAPAKEAPTIEQGPATVSSNEKTPQEILDAIAASGLSINGAQPLEEANERIALLEKELELAKLWTFFYRWCAENQYQVPSEAEVTKIILMTCELNGLLDAEEDEDEDPMFVLEEVLAMAMALVQYRAQAAGESQEAKSTLQDLTCKCADALNRLFTFLGGKPSPS